MAKKKVSNNPSQTNDLKPNPMADDSSALQIQNLKNLNAVLLKETSQGRRQIDSLQSALGRTAVTYDGNICLDLQNSVISVFVQNHLHEINLRFDALLGDKDREVAALNRQLSDLAARLRSETTALADERDGLAREARRLEESVDGERKLREEAEKLRLEGEEVLSRKQTRIAELEMDRDSALKSSRESVAAIETLKEEIEAVTREKNEVESRNNAQEQKIVALETELSQLNESSKKEEAVMRAKVLELEGNLGIALQKEEEMKMEISALLREKKNVEKSVEILIEEKDSVRKHLNAVQKVLEDKQRELDEAVRARIEIEEVKVNLENRIVELKESCVKSEEENKQLLSQVEHYRNAVEEAVLEKERIKKLFDEEQKKVDKMELLIARSRDLLAKRGADLEQLRSERDKLVEKEKTLEGHVSVLRKENDALQGKLGEARKESRDLNAKVEFWCSNSNKALALLKTTAAALVSQHKDRNGVEAASNENHVEEIQPYAQELDAIKKAFKSKEETVDEMKQQLASLNKSVVEAHKSKNLWTVISSATTIFVAVLAAYAAKGR